MKFIIKQEILIEHLNYVIKGVSNKNLIPILNCIKFELDDNGLSLMSTDNDIAIKTFISKNQIEKIDKTGGIVVFGKYIYEIIKKLPNELINIEEVVDSKIYISTENSSFHLNCHRLEEFPNLDLEDNKNPIILNKTVFKNMVNQTIFATSTQESRPVLTGINIKISDDTLECTATDSYRLAKKIIKLNSSVDELINIIIPTKNINEINKMIVANENDMEIHVFNNKVIFKFDNIIVLSRLINGTYPDTSKLIPNDFKITMTVNLDNLYNAIDRASLLTNEAEKNIIKLESNKNKINIFSNIPEIGKVEETLNVEKDTDEDIKIAFSSKYMIEALRALQCETVELLFNGEINPIIVKNLNDDSVIQLILPIRTY